MFHVEASQKAHVVNAALNRIERLIINILKKRYFRN